MSAKDTVTTQIRIPENLYTRVKALSGETGGNLNSTMLHLMHLGLRIFNDGVTIHPRQCEENRQE